MKILILLITLGSVVGEGAFLPVCQRTEGVKKNLETQTKKVCADILETDLHLIKRVAVQGAGITVFKRDDFTGLKNLEILNIRSNPYTELTEGLFDDLANLKVLVIIGGSLRHFPDDFLARNPLIEKLHLFRIPVRSISESVLTRLENLKYVNELDFDEELQDPEKLRLRRIFPENGNVQLNFN